MAKNQTTAKVATSTPAKPTSAPVFFATRNPTAAALVAALEERGLPVPPDATRLELLAVLMAAEVPVVLTGSVVPLAAKARYAAHGGTCGDALAAAFAAVEPALWASVASQNGVDFSRWGHLNSGQQRMNLGNVLRGKLRRGEKVVVGDEVFGAQE